MARMTLSGVEIDLRQAAGTTTFLRAHALVSGGAVADVWRGTDGLLVGRVHDPTLSPVAPTPGRQTSVRALVSRSAAATGPRAPEPAVAGTGLGLQFEVITDPDPVAADLGQGLRLLLRPVLMNHKGSWVRTGVTWSTLPYVSQVRTAAGRWQQRLLNEFLALARRHPPPGRVGGVPSSTQLAPRRGGRPT
jgi:hypothetical protein